MIDRTSSSLPVLSGECDKTNNYPVESRLSNSDAEQAPSPVLSQAKETTLIGAQAFGYTESIDDDSSLLTAIKKTFSEDELSHVGSCIKGYLDPSNPLKPTGRPAFEQALFCLEIPHYDDIEFDNFVCHLIEVGIFNEVDGNISAAPITPRVYEFLIEELVEPNTQQA